MPSSPTLWKRERAVAVVLAACALVAALLAGSRSPAAFGTKPQKTDEPCLYAHIGPKHLNEAQAREAILCLINKKRQSHGSSPLAGSGNLDAAAQRHTNAMVRRRCFDHTCPGEAGMATRIRNTGYLNGANSMGVGENIAAGNGKRGSPAQIVQSWMHSHPHRVTLLKGEFEHIGVGMSHGTPWQPHSGGATYTTDFGFVNG
jgi:uncharacterized protein YkwD